MLLRASRKELEDRWWKDSLFGELVLEFKEKSTHVFQVFSLLLAYISNQLL